MKLVPCLLLLCTLSMTASIPLASDANTTHDSHDVHHSHDAHHRYPHHIAEHNVTHEDNSTHDHEGRNLLVSMRVAPKFAPPPKPAPRPAPPAPKIVIKVNAPAPKPAPAPAPKPVATPKPAPAPAPKPVATPAPKLVIKVDAPAPKPASEPFPIFMTCDNEFDLYVGGKKIGKGSSWTTTYNFSPVVKAGDVIAIDGVDHGGPAAFIGVFNGKVTKSSDWKCTTSKFSNWNENDFNDSAWPKAVSFSRNQDNNIWRSVGGGSRPNIPADAEWLWTSDNNNHNRVYCRYTPVKVVVPVSVPVAAPKVVVPVAVPVAAPKVVVPVSVPVAAPNVVVPVAAKIVVSPTASFSSHSSQKVATSKEDVIGNVNNMHTRIVSIIHETQTLQKREIEQNKKNVNISQTDLDKFIAKQDAEQKQLVQLQASILRTNASIVAHYAQMTADSLYLQKLDLIKPQFLQTLDATNANFASLSDHVSRLVSDEHKKTMLDILARARNATVYDTRDLAQAFLAHYEKYKNVLRTDSTTYSQDLLNLKDLTQRYASGQTMFSGLKAEVARLRTLVASLKQTVGTSEADAAMFAQIEQIISAILSSKKTNFMTDGANKECAVSVLRSHVANGLV